MACPYHPGGASVPKKDETVHSDKDAIIPQPPIHWFTKNITEIDPDFPISSIWRLADLYGPIFKLDFVQHQSIVLSSHELINEVCDEDRFDKNVVGGLKETRALLGDGLFTAFPNEQNWWKAHRVLMPVFGPLAIKKMFPEMLDISLQMVQKWDRLGPDHEISTMAFDTIGLCAFSYRYNSFYLQDVHPFAKQMAEVLIESGRRANRTSAENFIRVFSAEHTKKNVELMWGLCDSLVAERKAHPQPDSKDLLNTMLNQTDPETGEKLSDESIRFNMVTFLVAGHETTSGTLSFMMYHLLKHPEIYHKAQAEVDQVLGDGPLEMKHLPQLKYIEACLRETLRFQGPISQIMVRPKEDTVIGGRYSVPATTTIQCNLRGLHHDRKVWGEDADTFRPERMLNGGFEALPPNAWKAFGNGRRACIGRAFAEQEMLISTALILQRFQVEMADPSYNLALKSTLTVKPMGFNIKVRRRPGKYSVFNMQPTPVPTKTAETKVQSTKPKDGAPAFLILYGSNAGTCKTLAEDLESAAGAIGFAPTVQTMDRATENLPKGAKVLIITPSYEGKPADNAKKFVSWLEASSAKDLLEGIDYAVFGLGNSEWTSTFHRIPRLVDDLLGKLGGHQLQPAGFVDVKEDLVGPWEDWREKILDIVSGGNAEQAKSEEIKVTVERPDSVVKLAGEDVSHGFVRKNDIIASAEVGPLKRHMEVELPEGVTYRTGDYLVVLPTNPPNMIKRAIAKFKLHPDDVVHIAGTNKTFLSGSGPSIAADLLGARVELGTPVSRRQLQTIAETAASDSERKDLESICSFEETFNREILGKRKSILDILEDFPSCDLPFGAYLDMVKPLSPRQYSISSSPLASDPHPEHDHHGSVIASVTFDVHEAPARSGNNRVFQGVASTYLATRLVGSKIRCFVRATNASFHLPADPEIPIIMISAGTGIAPMRGFIQERAQIANAGSKKLGKALLYFGCRHDEKDFIYSEQLKEWESLGAVEVRPAFSQHGPEGHHKYVPDRMWAEREELAALFRDGAKILVCGSASKLAKSSADVCQKIWMEKNPGKTETDAFEWLQKQREDRYVSDVFD